MEYEALALEIRRDNPALSEDQAMDAAAQLLAEMDAYAMVWDAQPTSVTTHISAYVTNWDRDALALGNTAAL